MFDSRVVFEKDSRNWGKSASEKYHSKVSYRNVVTRTYRCQNKYINLRLYLNLILFNKKSQKFKYALKTVFFRFMTLLSEHAAEELD